MASLVKRTVALRSSPREQQKIAKTQIKIIVIKTVKKCPYSVVSEIAFIVTFSINKLAMKLRKSLVRARIFVFTYQVCGIVIVDKEKTLSR